MRDYAKISTTLWRSKKFRSIDDEARLFYMYLHTCPHANSVGCFVLPAGYIRADLGWSEEVVAKAIDTLCKAYLIAFDSGEELIRIIDFVKHDPFTNPKHAAGAIKAALSLPECEEKLHLLNDLAENRHAAENEDLRKALDNLSKPYRNPEPNRTEPEPNQITDSNESVVGAGAPPACPHMEIIFLYNEILPELQHVIPDRWGGARQKALQTRWRESAKHQSLDFWKSFFTELRNHPWYLGSNDRGWKADLGWIIKRENFDKLIEKFTSGRRAA